MSEIKQVVIVGGGTAGWMAAAAISNTMGKVLDVSLIESDEVGTVGVGEATVPAMMQWLQYLGIEEADFIKRCNASFKLGVRFVHWDKDPKTGARRSYLNPFDGVGEVGFSRGQGAGGKREGQRQGRPKRNAAAQE